MTDNCGNCFFYSWHREGGSKEGVSVSVASPGVFTWVAHGLDTNDPVVFTTTGALPTGISASTAYYVVAIDADTFSVSATLDGSAIALSGTHSGVHTVDAAVMGCHRDAPVTADDDGSVRWKGVDHDYWCGDYLTAYATSALTWSDWTPAFTTGGAGALGTVTSLAARFAQIGKLVIITLRANVDTGTATVSINFTLPTTPNSDCALFGMTSGGLALACRVTGVSNIATVQKYDGTMPSSPLMYIGGTYETQ